MAAKEKRDERKSTAAVSVFELILPSAGIALAGIPGEPLGEAHTLLSTDEGFFISDEFNHRILCFDRGGRLLWTAGGKGSGPGRFLYPCGMAFFRGRLWVCDSLNGRLQVFDTAGGLIESLGGRDSALELQSPISITASADHLFIVDRGSDSVVVADDAGRPIASWTAREAAIKPGERITLDEAVFRVPALNSGLSPVFDWKGLKHLAFCGDRIWCLGNDRLDVLDNCGGLVARLPLPPLVAVRGLAAAGDSAFFLDEKTGGLARCRPDRGCDLFLGKERLRGCGIVEGQVAVITMDQRLLLIPPSESAERAAAKPGSRKGTTAARVHLAEGDTDAAAAELDELFVSDAIADPELDHDLIDWRFHRPDTGGKAAIIALAVGRIRHAAERLEALLGIIEEQPALYSTLLDHSYAYLAAVPYRSVTLPGWLMNHGAAESTAQFYSSMREIRHAHGLLTRSLPHLTSVGDDEAGGILSSVFDALSVILKGGGRAAAVRNRARGECLEEVTRFPGDLDHLRAFSNACARFTIADQFLFLASRLMPDILKAVPRYLRRQMPPDIQQTFRDASRLSCSIRDLLVHGNSFEPFEGPLERKPPAIDSEAAQIADSILEACSLAEELYRAERSSDIDIAPLVAASWRQIALAEDLRSRGKLFVPELVKLTARSGRAQLLDLGMGEHAAALNKYLDDAAKTPAKPGRVTAESLHETLGARLVRLTENRIGADQFAEELLKVAGGGALLCDALVDSAFVLPFDSHQTLLASVNGKGKCLARETRLRIAALGSALAVHAGDDESAARWRTTALEEDYQAALGRLGDSHLALGHRRQAATCFSKLFEVTRDPLAGLAVILTAPEPCPEDVERHLELHRHRIAAEGLYRLFNATADDWRLLEIIRDEILVRAALENPLEFQASRMHLDNLNRLGGFLELDGILSSWIEKLPELSGLLLMKARILSALGDLEGTLEILEALHSRFEPTLPSLELAAVCAMQAGKPDEAEGYAQRQVGMGKHPDLLTLQRANNLLWRGEPEAVLNLLGAVDPAGPLKARRAMMEIAVPLARCDFASTIESLRPEALALGKNSFRLWSYVLSMILTGEDGGYTGGLGALPGLRDLHTHRLTGEAIILLRSGKEEEGRRLAWAALHRNPGFSTFYLAPLLLDNLNRKPITADEERCLATLAERYPSKRRIAAFIETVRAWDDKAGWRALLPDRLIPADREEAFRNSLLGKLALRHGEADLALKLLEPLENRFGLPEVQHDLAEARRRLKIP